MAGLSDVLAGPVLDVAPRLLGARLSHAGVSVRLTEVEAYAGPDDPGSHAYRSRTARNAVMFGPPGRLYTYFSYGMHVCANVVCGPEGTASAVLLRAGEVVEGVELARERRPAAAGRDRDLARGPARLCQALGIGLQHGGSDLEQGPVTLLLGDPATAPATTPATTPGGGRGTGSPGGLRTGPRVGLRGAPERPWRFWIAGEPSVSAYRPAAPRRP
jgi:DNA-3-methyladenine glycosylase